MVHAAPAARALSHRPVPRTLPRSVPPSVPRRGATRVAAGHVGPGLTWLAAAALGPESGRQALVAGLVPQSHVLPWAVELAASQAACLGALTALASLQQAWVLHHRFGLPADRELAAQALYRALESQRLATHYGVATSIGLLRLGADPVAAAAAGVCAGWALRQMTNDGD